MGLIDVYIKPRSEEERKNEGVPWLEGEQRERAKKVLNPLLEVREKLLSGRPYICKQTRKKTSSPTTTVRSLTTPPDTHVIGVVPEHQGKNAGASIVRFGIDLCNRTGLLMYFEASPTSVSMHEKFGYERLNETVVYKADLSVPGRMWQYPSWCECPKERAGMTFQDL
jgi:hypothetical protein